MYQTLGIVVQLLGLVFLGVGFGVEVALRAHVGFILLTGGSILFAVGTKLRHERSPKRRRKVKPNAKV